MYDFSVQKEMFGVARSILQSIDVNNYALGGGTTLSACYWNHRNSTDIDIFLFEKDAHLKKIRDSLGKSHIVQLLKKIGYQGSFKYPGNYLEIEIDTYKKIQFFESKHYRPNAYTFHRLWGYNTNIESVDEIIYKKIFYRAEKCNARDIFDIALAIHKDPSILQTIVTIKSSFVNNLMVLEEALYAMTNNEEALLVYKAEIDYISPSLEFMLIAYHAPRYLCDYLEAFLIAFKQGALSNDFLVALEKEVYGNVVISSNTPK